MSRSASRFLLVTTVLGLAAGPVVASATAAIASGTPVFHRVDNGKTEHLSKGTTFKVRLKGCGDCGMYWSIARGPHRKVVKKIGPTVVRPVAKPPAVGGYDHTIWTFKVVGHGVTSLRLAEHDATNHNKVIKHFRLTINSR